MTWDGNPSGTSGLRADGGCHVAAARAGPWYRGVRAARMATATTGARRVAVLACVCVCVGCHGL